MAFIYTTPAKVFAYLFSKNSHGRYHARSGSQIYSSETTCIRIVPQKDGTAITKCIHPSSNTTSTTTANSPSSSSAHSPPSYPSSSAASSATAAAAGSTKHLRSLTLVPKFHSMPAGTKRRRRQQQEQSLQQQQSLYYGDRSPITPLLALPPELVQQIVLCLDCCHILELARTCKHLFSIICAHGNDGLWRHLFQTHFIYRPPIQQQKIGYQRLYQNHHILRQRWRFGRAHVSYLDGHGDSVYCIVRQGDRLYSGSRDRTIKVWHLPTMRCLSTHKYHQGSVLCLRIAHSHPPNTTTTTAATTTGFMSPSSSDLTITNDTPWLLVSGSSDGTCVIWNEMLEPQKRLVGHGGGVLDVSIVQRRIVSASRDATVRVWDIASGKEVQRLQGHAGPVNALQSVEGDSDDPRVISASGDGTLRLWNVVTGECLRVFVGHARGLACARWNGDYIYSGGQDTQLKVWNIHTGACVATLPGHTDLIRTVDCHEDTIVTGSYDRTLRVWDRRSDKCILSFQNSHESWIFNVAMTRTQIISGGQDKRIMVLDFGYGLDLISQ